MSNDDCIEVPIEDVLYQISEEEVCKHFDHHDLLLEMKISEIVGYLEPTELFEAIDAHVKGGTDPQFNQAYNKWRYNK